MESKNLKGEVMKKMKILSASYKLDENNKYGIIEGSLWQQESFSEYDVIIVEPGFMDVYDTLTDRNDLKTYVKSVLRN